MKFGGKIAAFKKRRIHTPDTNPLPVPGHKYRSDYGEPLIARTVRGQRGGLRRGLGLCWHRRHSHAVHQDRQDRPNVNFIFGCNKTKSYGSKERLVAQHFSSSTQLV